MQLKRYNVYITDYENLEFDEEPEGKWVKWEDVEQMQEELERLREGRRVEEIYIG